MSDFEFRSETDSPEEAEARFRQRIEELKTLKPGWLDGEGEALDPAMLDQAREALLVLWRLDALPLPFITPTPEGTLFVEWDEVCSQCIKDLPPKHLARRYGPEHILKSARVK